MAATCNQEDSRRAAIEQHIAEGTLRVARFRTLIRDTASRGDDTGQAQRILATMEAALTTLCKIRADNHYRHFDVEHQPLHFHGVDATRRAAATSTEPVRQDRPDGLEGPRRPAILASSRPWPLASPAPTSKTAAR